MAIRAAIGFDHLPQNDTSWINYATHGITRGADLSASNVIVNGWIVSKSTAAGSERVTIPLSSFVVAPVNKISVALRVKVVANTNGAAGFLYLNGTYVMTVNEIPGLVVGNIYHIEVVYDLVTGNIDRYVGGVKLGAGVNSNLGSNVRTLTFGLEAKGSTANRLDWRDLIVTDDQTGGQGFPVCPIGQQVVAPITFDTVTAPDFTTVPSNASLLTAINEPGAVPTTNIAVSATTKGVLTASFAPGLPVGQTVMAIEVIGGVSSNGASVVNCSGQMQMGANNGPIVVIPCPVGSYNYNAGFGVFHRNPAGGGWDNATLDATNFVLAPDV